MKTIFTIVACIGLSSLCLGQSNNYRAQYNAPQSNNNLEWSGYTYSIDEGQCGGTKLVDEEVRKESDPNTYKKTTYTWSGRNLFYITCVRVLNRMARDQNAAEARISDGGVGHGQVRIEMRSQDSQRTHFHIEIWGKETRTASSNIAVLSNAENVLYMHGKKYCECR